MADEPVAAQRSSIIEVRHIGVRIERPAKVVYDFVVDPGNLHLWAAGLAETPVYQVDGVWMAESPMGRVVIKFATHNRFGVLDHDVTLPTGEVVTNPMRVLADGAACDVVFTVRHYRGMTSEEFERDAALIAADLMTLRWLLEV